MQLLNEFHKATAKKRDFVNKSEAFSYAEASKFYNFELFQSKTGTIYADMSAIDAPLEHSCIKLCAPSLKKAKTFTVTTRYTESGETEQYGKLE